VHEQRHPFGAEKPGRLVRPVGRVVGDAGVERLALPHGRGESADGLLQWHRLVGPVVVEDVHVVEPEIAQAVLEGRQERLA
jgi:hypothetical protein